MLLWGFSPSEWHAVLTERSSAGVCVRNGKTRGSQFCQKHCRTRDVHTRTCRSKTPGKFRIHKSLLADPRSESTGRSCGVDRLGALRLRRLTNLFLCCRHHHCYLYSSGVLDGGRSQVTLQRGAHFIFIRRLEA